MLMAALIIFTALTVINISTINVQAVPPETWDTDPERIIQNETRYRENVTITVEGGNLTIKNNGTLVFNNTVTLKIMCEWAGRYGIKIEAGGQFIVNSIAANTKIMSDPDNLNYTYKFINSGTIDFL